MPSQGGSHWIALFFLPVERTWERQCHALRPLDEVEPISRFLAEVNGDSQPQLLLTAKTGFSPASESLAEEDSIDLLLVASREEGTRGSLQKRQRMARLIKRNTKTSQLQTERIVHLCSCGGAVYHSNRACGDRKMGIVTLVCRPWGALSKTRKTLAAWTGGTPKIQDLATVLFSQVSARGAIYNVLM
ncbi:hypothetical protein C4B63_295g12 [Trypanosoma cruzi]|uniref:Uncharacterized protein n=1 Tax=Trypanosoma cruzi TaxID=5693 RepID=A0A2V2UI86_TRYCR|nr:hypothetical protein C4B63_295g12 [Trypanosoma cruzi]